MIIVSMHLTVFFLGTTRENASARSSAPIRRSLLPYVLSSSTLRPRIAKCLSRCHVSRPQELRLSSVRGRQRNL